MIFISQVEFENNKTMAEHLFLVMLFICFQGKKKSMAAGSSNKNGYTK